MADRVSASIVLGGTITAADLQQLAELIEHEGLSTEWDGEPFQPGDITPDEPLRLYAHEVPWGRFEALESWCVVNAVSFTRWSGAYPGQWGAERIVFTGEGQPQWFAADEDGYVMIGRDTAERLGSIEAVIALFDAADFVVPPLTVAEAVPEIGVLPPRRREALCSSPYRGRVLRLAS